MSTATLTTSVEKIQPTAIIKLDGPLNDFHAKELIGIIDDLLPQNFVHFIINFDKCSIHSFVYPKGYFIILFGR